MKHLTMNEELEIIEDLMINNDQFEFLDCGSSRAVFSYREGTVVKIALDKGGLLQNKQEIEGYKRAPEICADIQAYGHNIIIMEAVDVCYDAPEMISDMLYQSPDANSISYDQESIEEMNSTYEVDDAEDRIRLFNSACEVFGDTPDNAQMGYRFSDGSLCLYDYGFRGDVDYCQVGDIESHLYNEDNYKPDYQSFLHEVYNAIQEA